MSADGSARLPPWQVRGERTVYDNPWVRVTRVDVRPPGADRFEHHVVRLGRVAGRTGQSHRDGPTRVRQNGEGKDVRESRQVRLDLVGGSLRRSPTPPPRPDTVRCPGLRHMYW